MKKIIYLILISFLLGCSDSKQTLYIFSWADYFNPEVINKFENDNNCQIVVDTFDSNEMLYAKLKAGGSGYDIIVPTSYQIPSLIKEDIVERIQSTNLPNTISYYDTNFSFCVYSPALTYSVPYMISYGGLMYNKNKVLEDDVKSWKVLENPKYRGRISLLNDIREVIAIGCFANDYSINTKSQKEIDNAVKYVRMIKPNVKKFDSESYKTEVVSGSTWIGHAYSSDATQVILGEDGMCRSDIGFILPKEGFTLCCDEFCIMKNSSQKELAYKFIDYLYKPGVCKENMEYVMSLTPHTIDVKKIDNKLMDILLPKPEIINKGQLTESFDNYPEIMEMYNNAWDEIMKR